jgi:hypothetical protein
MSQDNFRIENYAENMEKFMKDHVEKYETPAQNRLRAKIEKGDIIIVVNGSGEAAKAIIGIAASKPNGTDKIILSPEVMSDSEIEVKITKTSLVFVISKKDFYPGNFQGDHKKELIAFLRGITRTVDSTVRIGGLYMPEEYKGTVEGNRRLEEVEKWFENKYPGIKLQYRWSKSSGKFANINSAGYNILAKNDKMEKFTRLFKTGAHHYSKVKMFAFEVTDEKKPLKVSEGDETLKNMILEYTK